MSLIWSSMIKDNHRRPFTSCLYSLIQNIKDVLFIRYAIQAMYLATFEIIKKLKV